MTVSVILATLSGDAADAAILRGAAALARRFDAHLRALHVRLNPTSALYYTPEGALVTAELVATADREAKERAERARRAFDEWRQAEKIEIAETPPPQPAVTTSWREAMASGDAVAAAAMLADLVLLPARPEWAGSPILDAFQAALFESGRPVLLLPSTPAPDLLDTVVVAWKPGAQAARAVAGAMPLLRKARNVRIFAANEETVAPAAAPGIADYLAWHGVNAAPLSFSEGSEKVGATLLAEARRQKAGLIVMGGYGHSRLREFVLGGVTRDLLAQTEIPVLMAH